MEMTCTGSYGFLEEVTGPALYAQMKKPETYSTTSYIVIVRKEPVYISLASCEQVRLILSFYGFTKTELAKIIGISRPALYAWLDGTSEPTGANYEKLSTLAQLAHDIDVEPSVSLFHAYVKRPIPGYEKSLLEYLSGKLENMVFLSTLIRKLFQMTVERQGRLDSIPNARYSVDSVTLEDNLSSLSDGM